MELSSEIFRLKSSSHFSHIFLHPSQRKIISMYKKRYRIFLSQVLVIYFLNKILLIHTNEISFSRQWQLENITIPRQFMNYLWEACWTKTGWSVYLKFKNEKYIIRWTASNFFAFLPSKSTVTPSVSSIIDVVGTCIGITGRTGNRNSDNIGNFIDN